MNYLSLMSHTSMDWSVDDNKFPPSSEAATRRQWLDDLTSLIDTVEPTSHQITSTLSLLSASVGQGISLPPYIQLPQPYDLSRRLERLDKGILDARHVQEPGYAAYAVMQVASTLVMDDLEMLVKLVKDLVGETDFSFTVPTNDSSASSLASKGKGKND